MRRIGRRVVDFIVDGDGCFDGGRWWVMLEMSTVRKGEDFFIFYTCPAVVHLLSFPFFYTRARF